MDNNSTTLTRRHIVLATIMLIILACLPLATAFAAEGTVVSEDICADTAWTKAGSPYILEETAASDWPGVCSGAALTIEPGVVVESGVSEPGLWVFGQLIAQGTESEPIVFTILRELRFEDAVGATYDESGDYVDGSILEHVMMDGRLLQYPYGVLIDGPAPFVHRTTIENVHGPGIVSVSNPLLRVRRSTIAGNHGLSIGSGGGIEILGSSLVLEGSIVKNNGPEEHCGWGSFICAGGISGEAEAVTIVDSVITGNASGGLAIHAHDVTLKRNRIADNSGGGEAGGALVWYENLTMVGNVLARNGYHAPSDEPEAPFGGGAYLWADVFPGTGSTNIRGNVFAGNGAQFRGGGLAIYPADSSVAGSIRGNLFYGNETVLQGGAGISVLGTEPGDTADFLIYENIIAGNRGGLGGGGIQFGDDFDDLTSVRCARNSIVQNSSLIFGAISDYGASQFAYNTIAQNESTDSPSDTATIFYDGDSQFLRNNIVSNVSDYTLWNANWSGDPDTQAKQNWWGTASGTEIEALIYDGYDDASLAYVDFSPWEQDIREDTPVAPPTGLTITREGTNVIVSWQPNHESDIAGYKLHWDNDSGYPFRSSVAVGAATSYEVDIAKLKPGTRYTVAVTAYDTEAASVDDLLWTPVNERQTSGHESWFSKPVSILTP